MNIKGCYLFLLLSMPQIALCQTVSEYPVSFLNTSFNTFMQANEIRMFDSTRINVSSNIRKNTGLFSDVYQSKSQLGVNLKKSTLSLQLYTDRQGELIKRDRLYLNYNTHITLTKKLACFVGLSAGLVNKSLGNQNTNIQGNATVFDVSSILGLYGKQWFTSFSINQIPQNTITPINFEVPLLKYYQFYSSYVQKLDTDFTIEGAFITNMYATLPSEYIGGLQLTWKNYYKCGVEYSNYNIANYFIDCKITEVNKSLISLLFSYETNHNTKSNYNTSFAIFNVGLIIKVKK